ncbi:hypothetical protein GCM10027590_27850 [Nocardiopsis nanhaiensis]
MRAEWAWDASMGGGVLMHVLQGGGEELSLKEAARARRMNSARIAFWQGIAA